MIQKEELINRLEQISEALRQSGKGVALIGFGSTGAEIERMDCYSDLDFLAIVKKGCKSDFINSIEWLTSISPVAYYFFNYGDSFKLFFHDGIYCEFGVLEEEEISKIPHSEGRIIWSIEEFDKKLILSNKTCDYDQSDIESSLGEALTFLYVGLCRYARGEKLSAASYIQNLAVNKLLACSNLLCDEHDYFKDPFQNERRYEKRFPSLAAFLPDMIQGYEKSPESALGILKFIETYFKINSFMKEVISNLATELIQNK